MCKYILASMSRIQLKQLIQNYCTQIHLNHSSQLKSRILNQDAPFLLQLYYHHFFHSFDSLVLFAAFNLAYFLLQQKIIFISRLPQPSTPILNGQTYSSLLILSPLSHPCTSTKHLRGMSCKFNKNISTDRLQFLLSFQLYLKQRYLQVKIMHNSYNSCVHSRFQIYDYINFRSRSLALNVDKNLFLAAEVEFLTKCIWYTNYLIALIQLISSGGCTT